MAFSGSTSRVSGCANLRWTRLTKAGEVLTQASKLPQVENLASIHIERGDVELLRLQLGKCSGRQGYAVFGYLITDDQNV